MAKDKPVGKVRIARLYRADDIFVVLADDGQDFAALFEAFNRQDHPDTNKDWMGFKDYMRHRGVRVLGHDLMNLESFQPAH